MNTIESFKLILICLQLFTTCLNAFKCVPPCMVTIECTNDTECLKCFCPTEFVCPQVNNCNANCGISIEKLNNKSCPKCKC